MRNLIGSTLTFLILTIFSSYCAAFTTTKTTTSFNTKQRESFYTPLNKFNTLTSHSSYRSQSRSPFHLLQAKTNNNNDNENENGNENNLQKLQKAIDTTYFQNPSKSLKFSILISLCGASLGPFLDSYHSLFGVLTYDSPITSQLWSPLETGKPALVTTWWVPVLFGLAGFIIGWLTIILDQFFYLNDDDDMNENINNEKAKAIEFLNPSVPKILYGISFFTFQYYLSGILFSMQTIQNSPILIDRTSILNIMSILAVFGFYIFDGLTLSGFWTFTATAIGGPLIEVGLITVLNEPDDFLIPFLQYSGYHYNDLGETGFFPLWIVPVYFLGGPAVGNLARGFYYNLLGNNNTENEIEKERGKEETKKEGPNCEYCNDTRCVPCPNCDGQGYYITYNKRVTCNCCKGRGFVMCRNCFSDYGDDPAGELLSLLFLRVVINHGDFNLCTKSLLLVIMHHISTT